MLNGQRDSSRSRWWIPAWIFALALAARCAHVWAMRDTSFVRFPTIDPAAYEHRAQEILSGKWFPDDVFFQDPLYPYLLAAMHAITGGSALGAYFGQAAVSAFSCVLMYILGERYICRRAGIVCGVIAACYAPFIYLDGQLEKNTFTIITMLGALAAFPARENFKFRRVALSGAILGCGVLLRGNYLLIIPALAAVLIYESWPLSRIRGSVAAAIFVIACAAPIAPVTYHNWRASGDFILTTAQAGTALYLGNNPQNTSGGIHAVSFNRQIPEFEADDWKREAERRSGRSMSRVEVSKYWFGSALGHIIINPGPTWWFSLLCKKAELILNGIEVPDNTAMAYVEKLSPVVGFNPVRFATIAPFGLAGLLIFMMSKRRLAASVAFGIYSCSLLLFPISDRFRAPVAVFMILCAGAAFEMLWVRLRGREFGRLAFAAAALAGCILIVNHEPWLQPPDTNIRAQNAMLKAYHDDVGAWINGRQYDRAEAVLRKTMADEWFAKKTRLNLDLAMVLWYGHRDGEGAKSLIKKSLAAMIKEGETAADGYLLYAEILESGGDAEQAAYWKGRAEAVNLSNYGELFNIAKTAGDLGDRARATGLLDEFVLADQRFPSERFAADHYILLARLQIANNQTARAVDTLKKLAARGGAVPDDLRDLLK
ncbi:MAG: glycosyltransferase family 39 protein [Planctomycetes bacterium]|nr:glycosyltransferase family 39 protein [Planctomycetota bacterium]